MQIQKTIFLVNFGRIGVKLIKEYIISAECGPTVLYSTSWLNKSKIVSLYFAFCKWYNALKFHFQVEDFLAPY